jgi:hypothetical protein
MGMGVPLLPVAELANPVNRPGKTMALPWGADQAQQPHAVVWAPAGSSDGSNRNQPCEHPPYRLVVADEL